MIFRLCTGIEQEDVTLLHLVDESMIVEHLSLYRGDGGEGQRITVSACHFLDDGSHL